MRGGTVIVKLKRDADDVIAFAGKEAGDHGGIHASGHGDHDAGVLRAAGKIKTVHGISAGFKGRFQFLPPYIGQVEQKREGAIDDGMIDVAVP